MSCRKRCLLGLVFAVLAALPILQGGSKKGTQYAILVAISKYGKTDQWRSLPYTIDEMREFRDVLLTTGFTKENIEFLHDQQADEKLRPTGANLLKKIKLMLEEIGPDDTLLVALNGHGIQYKGEATGYFCPVNADLLDKKTLVAMDGKDGIYGLLETCKAKRKLLIVNACRNDPTRDLSFAAEKVQLIDKDESEVPKGIAALFSCKPGQKSYYYPEEQKINRSMFFHHVIEAWRGKYAEGEKVTLDHVFDTVTRKTAADARTIFSEAQTPWPRRKYEGEWLVSAVPDRPLIDPNPKKPGVAETKETITNSIGMKLAYIPPGKFMMGSPKEEKERGDDELQHEVEITKGFHLGIYAVTQEEYETVMGKNPSYFQADGEGKKRVAGLDTRRFPAEEVSWDDAKEFCRKLGAKDGKMYRLPSEAEWEYACRAGTTTPFHFGETISMDQANYFGSQVFGKEKKGEYRDRTMKVGSFAANSWGLHDMHGNVCQWCEDWYDKDYYVNSPSKNPINEAAGTNRVGRGGSWTGDPRYARSASRNYGTPGHRSKYIGFRVLLPSP